ncbi:MAG: putative O-methyltransferase [Phycisphaerae bacterium]|nr:MAG: putative O-methyltransferase [Phycisphaerae bacterium]
MDMTPEHWRGSQAYLDEVFGDADDEHLRTLMPRAVAAGLPDIAVSPSVARFVGLLAHLATHHPRSTGRVLEVGTLAGYSGIHLARNLRPGATLTTIEFEPKHAAFARAAFDAAGVGARVDIVVGAALDVLPRLARAFGDGSLDMVFLDATKVEYPRYLDLVTPMLRPGGILAADNILGSHWWITDPPGSSPERDAMDRFNRGLATSGHFQSAGVFAEHGIVIGLRTDK